MKTLRQLGKLALMACWTFLIVYVSIHVAIFITLIGIIFHLNGN